MPSTAEHPRYPTVIHEAGHAVACAVLGKRFKHVTIKPKENDYLGCILYWVMDKGLQDLVEGCGKRNWTDAVIDRYVRRKVIISYAGHAAELEGTGKENPDGAAFDHESIADYVTRHAVEDDYCETYYKECHQSAEKLIAGYWPQVEAVAAALLERTTLTGKEVYTIVGDACHTGKKYLTGYAPPPQQLQVMEELQSLIAECDKLQADYNKHMAAE